MNIDEMIELSKKAQIIFDEFSQEKTDKIVKAVAKVVFDNAERYAKMAVEETGMGVYEHKIKKNMGKAKIIWNSLKNVKSKGILERNEDSGIVTIARSMGIVCAATPCTNPIVTPMCNIMFALKGGNSIIIAPHPRGKKCAKVVIDDINKEISTLGAPKNLVQLLQDPSVELTKELMGKCDVVVATGGMPMVRSAYSSGKPAFGVGAGNVQCIIDRDIEIETTVKKIIEGREFDNGIICSGEQTIIAPKENYVDIIERFKANGCVYFDNKDDYKKLSETIFPAGVMNKNLVGVSAYNVAKAAGIEVPEKTRVLLIKADGYGKGFSFSKEKMCPVISTYVYDNFKDAVKIAQANLDVEGRGHSVSLHSNNKANIEYAGEKLTVSRLLINQICSTMNGGSFLNSLTPTTTLGCASWGGNSISENFSHKHLLNIIRIAYPKKNAKVPTDAEIWSD